MHAEPFEYHRAESVTEAVELLETSDDGRLLAGGQGLIPLLKKREIAPGTLVDIGGIDDLRGIERTGSGVRIGALTTHREITDASLLADAVPVLPSVVAKISGGIQVHNVATIGGNIARAHPAYDYAGALLASRARINITGPDGERAVPAVDFFSGICSTCLGDAELITDIEIDAAEGERCGGYAKRKEPASGGAVLGVATEIVFEGGRVRAARLAANGLCGSAVRLGAVEDVLAGSEITDSTISAATDAAGDTLDEADILDNKKASAEYRHQLLGPYVRRSVERATPD